MIHNTQSAQISNVIMKTMWPPGYHHNGFAATHALGYIMYGLWQLMHLWQLIHDVHHYEDNWEGTLFS